jgi:heptosyltransferase-1
MNKQKEILIVKMSAIGDVIHTLPALNAIRKQFPDARITWLVEEAAADIVLGHKALDRVIVSKRKQWIKELFSLKCGHAIKNIRNFLKELRNTKYDMIIDFQTLFKSGIMVMLAKGKRKIGFNKGMDHAESSHIFYNERIRPVSMEIHALERGLLLLKSLNIPCKKIEYDLPVTNKEKLNVDNLLRQKDIDPEKPIICINPQATWETKLWDSKKFADLSDRLKKKYHAQIVFTGGKSDQEAVNDIVSMMKLPGINLAGLTTLKTLAALYEKAALIVTTDTGPMHLAAAMGTKVVAIFGSTAPWRTGPYGSNNFIVRSDIYCSPCFKRECSTKECMENINVDDVMKGVKQLMDRNS